MTEEPTHPTTESQTTETPVNDNPAVSSKCAEFFAWLHDEKGIVIRDIYEIKIWVAEHL